MEADPIHSAYEALVAGDPTPLVGLTDPKMEWRGRRRLSRFWQPAPS